MSRQETPITPELLERALSALTPGAVLVGGQALAVWLSYYRLDLHLKERHAAVSYDADFLGKRADVAALAAHLKAQASYPPQRAITALVGQVTIPTGEDGYVNLDVIHRVVGLDAEEIRRRAAKIRWGDVPFDVMHPLDVLASRVENLLQIADKRNTEGAAQARLATHVARAYIIDLLQNGHEKRVLKAIERVVQIAKSAAGRCAAREFNVEFAIAIPAEQVQNPAFQNIRLPRLYRELSEAAGMPLTDSDPPLGASTADDEDERDVRPKGPKL